MKFERIELMNFMRYKGKNEIVFSCDNKRNVTVVLGDNTVGKTTIAQAFRFVLYNHIMVAKDKREEDYELLNEDVLALMDANSRASVMVTLMIVDTEKRYKISREIQYVRKYPKLIAEERLRRASITIFDKISDQEIMKVDDNDIDKVVNELFPRDLSQYFLFDGEKWNDITVNGVKENIEKSVHKLTGLAPMQEAMKHLKDMGSSSVIRSFKSKIKGSGAIYESLQADINKYEHFIEEAQGKINTDDNNIVFYQDKCAEIEQFLLDNKETEVMQEKERNTQIVLVTKKENTDLAHRNMINAFSDGAFIILAKPMIEASTRLLKEANVERRDIPHIRQATIDYLIEKGECICGTKITNESEAKKHLLDQRNYLPPADIGSILGDFEKEANRWQNKRTDYIENIYKAALEVSKSRHDLDNLKNEFVSLQKEMDKNINFKEKRQDIRRFREQIMSFERDKGINSGKIESFKSEINHIENEMTNLSLQTQENKKWNERVELAEKIYEKISSEFSVKERKIFIELNEGIQRNFSRMFNARDKKIELDKNYNIRMLYKTENGFKEEHNLSEGEKIARNFAFIVSIMEYSKEKKAGELNETDSLPIVLDGPFSKLGAENIALTAKVLPEIAEQVIIFMLEKDWKYTNLDEYVGARYHIDKDKDKAYASISRGE